MWAHNKKVRPRQFKKGDLVLKKILPNQQNPRGKWAPNWQGPYVVKKTFSKEASILTKMDGNELSSPINVDVVKKYYAWVALLKKMKTKKMKKWKKMKDEKKGMSPSWKSKKEGLDSMGVTWVENL